MSKFIIASVFIMMSSVAVAKDLVIWIAYPPGGPSGKTALELQKIITPYIDANISIKSVPGAGGLLGVKTWYADDDTDNINLHLNTDRMFVGTYVAKEVPSDFADKIKPIANLGKTAYIVHGSNALGITNLKDIDNAGKDTVTLGVQGKGTPTHVFALGIVKNLKEKYNIKTKINIVIYPGGAKLINDIAGGHVDLGIVYPSSSKSFIDKGMTTAVAISAPINGISAPTFADLGFDGILTHTNFGIFARDYVPAGDLEEVRIAIEKGFDDPAVKLAWETNLMMIGPTADTNMLTQWYNDSKSFYMELAKDPAYQDADVSKESASVVPESSMKSVEQKKQWFEFWK